MKKTPPTAWKPGQSGNPAGRPRGSGKVGAMREAIAEAVPELLQTLLQRALEGDVGAARLLLERAIPPLKAQELPQALALPDGTLTEQGRALLQAVANGELAPGQGAALIAALGQLARVAEIDELTRRLEALEGVQYGKP